MLFVLKAHWKLARCETSGFMKDSSSALRRSAVLTDINVMHRSPGTEADVLIHLWLHHRLISEVPLAQYGNTKLGHYQKLRCFLIQ
jgi:hypothetical protein